jgi:hypothetical protein
LCYKWPHFRKRGYGEDIFGVGFKKGEGELNGIEKHPNVYRDARTPL